MASVTTARGASGSGSAVPDQGDPLVPRMLLGRRLRELREERGLDRDAAARAIGASPSKISRLEQGGTPAREDDVTRLLGCYGVSDEAERETLLALADQGNVTPWWYGHRDVVPGWVRPYLSAERAARLVRTFEPDLVPGLLQAPGYASAVIARDVPEHEVERRVELRMLRQRVLRRRPRPLNLWVVVDEAALRAPVAGPAVMREQLHHLIDMCYRPNVTVQIAPFDVCRRTAADGPVTLVRFAQQDLPDMVYLEHPGGGAYPRRRGEIEHHWHVFNTLVTEASPPERSPQIIERVLAGLAVRTRV